MKNKTIIIFIVLSLLLTGCSTPIQLNERAIVQAIGIDLIDNQYNLTVIYYSPVGTSGQEVAQNTQTNSKVVTANGKSLSEAFNNIELKNGKMNFYGHNNIVVIGSETAKKSLGKVISHMSGDLSLRANVELLAADNTAYEILNAKLNENIMSPTALINNINGAKKDGLIPNTRFIDIANAYLGNKLDVLLPLAATKIDADNQTSYNVCGAVAYKDDKYAGVLSGEEVLGINLSIRNLTNKIISVSGADGYALKLTRVDNGVTMDSGIIRLKIDCNAIIIDTMSDSLKIDESERVRIAKSAENYIAQLAYNGLKKTILNYGVNIFFDGNNRTLTDINTQINVNIDKSGAIPIKP